MSALLTGASALGVKVKDTIKVVNDDETIKDTPDRSTLRAIQTPQVFDKDKYIKFLENAKMMQLTLQMIANFLNTLEKR